MKNQEWDNQTITLSYIMAIFAADVDLFLLQNKEQTGDNDKESFTHEEIRDQLHKTCEKLGTVLLSMNLDIDKPLDDLIMGDPVNQIALN